jgi:hypothetical protein
MEAIEAEDFENGESSIEESEVKPGGRDSQKGMNQ